MGNVASAGPVARSLEPQRNDAATGAAAELELQKIGELSGFNIAMV